MTDKLAAIGAAVAAEDQVVTLLGSLPESYATLVTALEVRADDNLDINFVHQALLNEELKRQEMKPQQKVKSENDATLCPYQKTEHMNNHQAQLVEAQQPEQYDNDNSTNNTEWLFVGSGGAQADNKQWLIDSGDSSHMTNQRELLINFKEFECPEKSG
ncbi:uncharacterized protein [Watersipora subatra]|uniref:uncharacterized protein n=1 Tax=Watersipora subatra TaxID=2589382 RepID=UPI00355B88A5